MLTGMNNVLLPTMKNVVNRHEQCCTPNYMNNVVNMHEQCSAANYEQCCQQGCSAMKTMLLQHYSTTNTVTIC